MTDAHDEERTPALIRLHAPPAGDFDRALALIERAGGRVLHAHPPHAIIAELSPARAASLVGQAGVAAVHTDEIPTTRAAASDDAQRAVADAWNAHLRARRDAARSPSTRGLAWDAPGLLPPDPPADVRAELRRREREMRGEPPSHEEGHDPGS